MGNLFLSILGISASVGLIVMILIIRKYNFMVWKHK